MNDIARFLDENLKVKSWPSKKDFKTEILKYISTKFEEGRFYKEKEVNMIIEDWHTFGDYFLLRRGLIDYKFLARTRDGSKYWKEEVKNISDGESTARGQKLPLLCADSDGCQLANLETACYY